MSTLETQVRETFAAGLRRQARTVVSSLQAPTVTGLERCVQLLSQTVEQVNVVARLEEPQASAVREGVLYDAYVPLLYVKEGRIEDAVEWLSGSWHLLAGHESHRKRLKPLGAPVANLQEVIRLYNIAWTSWVITESESDRPREKIPRLMTSLRLSFVEVGRMLGVSDETARRWSTGASRMPPDKLAILDIIDNALAKLHRLFKTDRLPEVIRRPAEIFEGQTALAWILEGKIAEVADRYDRELSWQT